MDVLTITKPDDWHLHLRDGDALRTTVPAAARGFNRGIIMPNLAPPVTTVDRAIAYRERIMAARPEGSTWEPLMVLYLTDNTKVTEIEKAKDSGIIYGCKYYPAGATTNSDSGVTSMSKIINTLNAMEKHGLVLELHGEVTTPGVDIFDREAVFIEKHLVSIVENYPDLKIILEHITTKDGAEFVAEAPANVGATITPQHLLYNRNDMLVGGIRPHLYCLPILKRNIHQQALIKAATSGSPKFFLGTDSAPHVVESKETSCGCAGCFSHHAAIELYAMAFEQANALDKLEAFASFNGADFYGLPRNQDTVTLRKQDWTLPETIDFGQSSVVPLAAGETIGWKLQQ